MPQKNKAIGSKFDDFLTKEGINEEVEAGAIKLAAKRKTTAAINNAQKAFEGAAKDFGVNSDEDVQRLVDDVRYKTHD